MFSATGILVGTFFLNSLYLQSVQRSSALRVGLEFLPLALAIGAGAHLTGRLLPRIGSRLLIVAGLVLMGGGALLLTTVSARSGYLSGVLPGLLVIGAGTGLVSEEMTVETPVLPVRGSVLQPAFESRHGLLLIAAQTVDESEHVAAAPVRLA
jgi:hypothetical protein